MYEAFRCKPFSLANGIANQVAVTRNSNAVGAGEDVAKNRLKNLIGGRAKREVRKRARTAKNYVFVARKAKEKNSGMSRASAAESAKVPLTIKRTSMAMHFKEAIIADIENVSLFSGCLSLSC